MTFPTKKQVFLLERYWLFYVGVLFGNFKSWFWLKKKKGLGKKIEKVLKNIFEESNGGAFQAPTGLRLFVLFS